MKQDEILEAEKTADARKQNRKKGFEKAKERDAGHGVIRDYNGKAREIHMLWGTGGKFKLDIDLYGGQSVELVLDAEQFRKLLRWV